MTSFNEEFKNLQKTIETNLDIIYVSANEKARVNITVLKDTLPCIINDLSSPSATKQSETKLKLISGQIQSLKTNLSDEGKEQFANFLEKPCENFLKMYKLFLSFHDTANELLKKLNGLQSNDDYIGLYKPLYNNIDLLKKSFNSSSPLTTIQQCIQHIEKARTQLNNNATKNPQLIILINTFLNKYNEISNFETTIKLKESIKPTSQNSVQFFPQQPQPTALTGQIITEEKEETQQETSPLLVPNLKSNRCCTII